MWQYDGSFFGLVQEAMSLGPEEVMEVSVPVDPYGPDTDFRNTQAQLEPQFTITVYKESLETHQEGAHYKIRIYRTPKPGQLLKTRS
jgi:hypothetical protein